MSEPAFDPPFAAVALDRETLLTRFDAIRQFARGGRRAPNKPLLLLYALARLKHDRQAQITFNRTETSLQPLLRVYGPWGASARVSYPYSRLVSDGLWQLPGRADLFDAGGNIRERVAPKRDAPAGFTPTVPANLRVEPGADRGCSGEKGMSNSPMNGDQLAHWLEQDDAESRPHRAQRAKQVLDSITFPESGFLFFGGMESSQSFTEARLAYVNGLYLATVLLALVVAEQELAGTLYAAGVEKAKKLKLEDLLSVSLEERLITQGEHELLNKLREIRNAYSHYRPLSHPSKLARRSISTGAAMEDVLKEDALNALKAIDALVQRRAVR